MLLYVGNKKVLQDLCNSAPIAETASNEALVSAAKVIQNFENPTINSEKNSGNLQSTDDVRFSISPEEDAEYMEAVESGDMEKAGAMVKAAFKARFPNTKVVDENGEPLVVYHGMRTT